MVHLGLRDSPTLATIQGGVGLCLTIMVKQKKLYLKLFVYSLLLQVEKDVCALSADNFSQTRACLEIVLSI